jgi:hypothetical protein
MLAPQKTSSTTQNTEEQSAQTSYGVDNRPSTARQLAIQRMMNNGGASTTKTFNGPMIDPTELEGSSGSTNDNDDPHHVDENAINEKWGEQGEQEQIANSSPEWKDWSVLLDDQKKLVEADKSRFEKETKDKKGYVAPLKVINYRSALEQYLQYLYKWKAEYKLEDSEIASSEWTQALTDLESITKDYKAGGTSTDVTDDQLKKAYEYKTWVSSLVKDQGGLVSKGMQKEEKMNH